MPQNSFFPQNHDLLVSQKTQLRHFFPTLHPLSMVIFATSVVVAFILLCNSRFNFHWYTQHEATPAQKLAQKWHCDLSRLLVQKITKGSHLCKPASLNRPIANKVQGHLTVTVKCSVPNAVCTPPTTYLACPGSGGLGPRLLPAMLMKFWAEARPFPWGPKPVFFRPLALGTELMSPSAFTRLLSTPAPPSRPSVVINAIWLLRLFHVPPCICTLPMFWMPTVWELKPAPRPALVLMWPWPRPMGLLAAASGPVGSCAAPTCAGLTPCSKSRPLPNAVDKEQQCTGPVPNAMDKGQTLYQMLWTKNSCEQALCQMLWTKNSVQALCQMLWTKNGGVQALCQMLWTKNSVQALCQMLWTKNSCEQALCQMLWTKNSCEQALCQMLWTKNSGVQALCQMLWTKNSGVQALCQMLWTKNSGVQALCQMLWTKNSGVQALCQMLWTKNSGVQGGGSPCSKPLPLQHLWIKKLSQVNQ